MWHAYSRTGVNSAPEFDFLANYNSGIGIELAPARVELQLNRSCHIFGIGIGVGIAFCGIGFIKNFCDEHIWYRSAERRLCFIELSGIAIIGIGIELPY